MEMITVYIRNYDVGNDRGLSLLSVILPLHALSRWAILSYYPFLSGRNGVRASETGVGFYLDVDGAYTEPNTYGTMEVSRSFQSFETGCGLFRC